MKSTILECNKEVGNGEKVFVDVILDEDMPNVCPLTITNDDDKSITRCQTKPTKNVEQNSFYTQKMIITRATCLH